MPGIGLIKRRLETEAQAVALATSHVLKEYITHDREEGRGRRTPPPKISTLEVKYDADSGDWYAALGWNHNGRRTVVIRMDSILGTVTGVREISP